MNVSMIWTGIAFDLIDLIELDDGSVGWHGNV